MSIIIVHLSVFFGGKKMKAIILAGGSGKSLQPLTYSVPKSMVRLFSRPVLAYVIDLLVKNGFDDITLTAGCMAQQIEDYLSSFNLDSIRLKAVMEQIPLGTAGSLKSAAKDFKEPFLVINGECVCDFELNKIMKFHNAHNADVTVACTKVSDPRECDVIEFDDDDKVKAFTDKPTWSCVFSDCVSTGIYVLNPEILHYIPDGRPYDFSKELFPLLMREGFNIVHCQQEGFWSDIGNPEAFLRCQADILDKKSKIELPSHADGIYSEQPVESENFKIIKPCFIGRNVTVGAGSVIGPYAVIEDGCKIGENTSISSSALLPYSSIGGNCEIKGSIVCEKSIIKSGTALMQGSVIGGDSIIGSGSLIGRHMVIPPQSLVENGTQATKDIQYSHTVLCLKSFNRFSGQPGTELGSVNASIIGQALASMEIGKKTGVLTDGTPVSKAFLHSLCGALMLHGAQVWNFGEGFYSQLEFYTRFCGMKSGIFISYENDEIQISLCGENGLSLSNLSVREIENRIKYRDFVIPDASSIKDVSDMTGVNMMYRREIIRQSDTELSDVACTVKSSNEKIKMLIDDCLYRLGCRTGDSLTFTINRHGTLLSAFSRDCGNLSHERLAAICLNYEAQNGRDVSAPFNSPAAYDGIASKHGRQVYRYYNSPTDFSDAAARELSRSSAFMRDALFMAVKILNIMAVTGKSLKRLSNELPQFYVTKKSVDLSFSPAELSARLSRSSPKLTREGIIITYPQGRVLLTPSKSGKSLRLLAEADSYEISKDLCSQAEKLIENQ